MRDNWKGRACRWGQNFWKWLGRLVMSGFLALTALTLIVLIFPNTVLKWCADSWSTASSPPAKADAIFILGGGNDFRPEAAAALWKTGHAPKIYVFSPSEPLGSKGGDETIRILTEKFDVPRQSIEIIDSPVTSTFDEAVAGGDLIRERKWASVIIPTHLFHTRRVEWIFSKHIPEDCKLVVTEAPYVHFHAKDWWKNEWGLLQFPNEVLKTIFYFIRY